MKRFIGFLILCVAFAVVRQAGAAEPEICKPVAMHSDGTPREQMCYRTAQVLAKLVRDSGQPCEFVIQAVLDPANKIYVVWCETYATDPNHVVEFPVYSSAAGQAFTPARN